MDTIASPKLISVRELPKAASLQVKRALGRAHMLLGTSGTGRSHGYFRIAARSAWDFRSELSPERLDAWALMLLTAVTAEERRECMRFFSGSLAMAARYQAEVLTKENWSWGISFSAHEEIRRCIGADTPFEVFAGIVEMGAVRNEALGVRMLSATCQVADWPILQSLGTLPTSAPDVVVTVWQQGNRSFTAPARDWLRKAGRSAFDLVHSQL